MKAKYRLKKTGDNEYTLATGVRAYTLKGGSNCVVSAVDTVYSNKYKVQPHAFYIFNCKDDNIPFNSRIKVHSTCGATNCVNRDHLIGEYKPTKEDAQYIKDYLRVDGSENISHRLNVPLSLFEAFLSSQLLTQ